MCWPLVRLVLDSRVLCSLVSFKVVHAGPFCSCTEEVSKALFDQRRGSVLVLFLVPPPNAFGTPRRMKTKTFKTRNACDLALLMDPSQSRLTLSAKELSLAMARFLCVQGSIRVGI